MSQRTTIALFIALVAVQIYVLYALGQPVICDCGYVKVWEGVVSSSGTSQHITDWYTFSHVIHGILFFFILTYLFPKLSFPARLIIALGLEVGWEVLENTPMVIEHYRQQALAQGYVGDSILNSLSDTFAMLIGFIFTSKVRWWTAVIVMIAFEAFTIYMVKDSLLLNIIGFVAPDLFSGWQSL